MGRRRQRGRHPNRAGRRFRLTRTPHSVPGIGEGVMVKTALPPRKHSESMIAMYGGGDGGGAGGPGGGGGGSGLVGWQLMYLAVGSGTFSSLGRREASS